MKHTSKRAWSGLAAIVAAVLLAPLLTLAPAFAAGGPATVRTAGGGAALGSGTSATTFTLRLPPGSACGGDSANDGYRVQSYMVPVSVDPSTLTFNSSGPIPAAVGANFRQPLFETTGTPYVNAQTANAASPPGPGPIINIPDFSYGSVFTPGNIPAGQYNIGIACTLGPAGPTQLKEFWNLRKTFTTNPSGGPAQVSWTFGSPAGNGCNASGVPAALISWYPANPGSMSALHTACSWNNQPGTSQVSASFTVHDPAVANYHNGAAKGVTNSAAAIAGATTIQLNTAANGIVGLPVAPTQMNRMITGPGIAVRTHVRSMTAGGLVTLSRPTTGAVPISSALKIENSSARIVDDATSALPDLLNSTQANFTAADIGLSVSGTGIANGTSILAVNSPTQVRLDNPVGSPLGGPIVSIGGSDLTANAKVITQASITTAVRINSSAAGWLASDVGLKVTGTCHQNTAAGGDDTTIPANTVITATPTAANADTTGGLPAGSTGCNLVIGESNANAPANGDVVAQQGVQLNLNPSLVAGSADCFDDQPEGFGIVAKWYNPGSFQGIGATNAVPGAAEGATTLASKAIGQLFFDTSAADFSAFIIQRKAFTAGDPIGAAHFDVVFPFAPTTLAMCPGSATSPGLTSSLYINSTTQSQSTLATGTGRPGTGQVRNIVPTPTGGYTVTAFVDSQGPVTFSPASAFNRLCIYPAGFPNAANFQCGPG